MEHQWHQRSLSPSHPHSSEINKYTKAEAREIKATVTW